MNRLTASTVVMLCGLLAAGLPVFAQEKFPSRPLEIVARTPPGGGTDLVTR